MLTRNNRENNNSSEIRLWVCGEQGAALLRIQNQKPVFFVLTSQTTRVIGLLAASGISAETRDLALNSFSGLSVSAVYTQSVGKAYRAIEVLKTHYIETFEADIRLQERFLMERFIYAGIEFSGPSIARGGFSEYLNPRISPVEFKPKLKVLSLDIECDTTGELFCVGIAGERQAQVLMIGSPSRACAANDIDILWCTDESRLLKQLITRLRELDPDIIIGWNLINFDLRLLLARCRILAIKFSIGRDGSEPEWRNMRGEKDKGFISIAGRVAIDGIDALKTATYRFASFSLENVSQQLLGKGKLVEKSVHNRLAEIQHNFKFNQLALARYNLQDCQLVNEIFSATQILDFLILRSQLTGLAIDRVGGAVAAFYNLYLPRMHRGGFVAPNPDLSDHIGSPGGYVMDSQPGLYKNIIVLDFKSLYPAIIRTFKIDPMGLAIGLLDDTDTIAGFRGARFNRQRHFLPEIITEIWQQRDIAKANKDDIRSQALKILMNSFYGILGSSLCCFYDPMLASSITMRGHEIMQTTGKWLEQAGHDVIYGDTDSLFLSITDADSVAQATVTAMRLRDEINARWKTEIRDRYDLESFLEMELETCFSRFLMPTIRGSNSGSKKRYAGLVETPKEKIHGDDNAYVETLVFKGLENVRTDWTELARKFQATLYDLVFHDQDPRAFIRETVLATQQGHNDKWLVYRKQLRRPLADYVKNVPPHVKAARLADRTNKNLGRAETYQHKGWINYLITLNGPEPEEYLSSSLDYQHYVDKQLKPIADGILPFVAMDFASIINVQTQIF